MAKVPLAARLAAVYIQCVSLHMYEYSYGWTRGAAGGVHLQR